MGKNGLVSSLIVNPFKMLVFVLFILILLLGVRSAMNMAKFGGLAFGQAVGTSVVFVKGAVGGMQQTLPPITTPSGSAGVLGQPDTPTKPPATKTPTAPKPQAAKPGPKPTSP